MSDVASKFPAGDGLAAALVGHPQVAALVAAEPDIAAFAQANPDLVALALKDPEAVARDPRAIQWGIFHPLLAAQLKGAAQRDAAAAPPMRHGKAAAPGAGASPVAQRVQAAWSKVAAAKSIGAQLPTYADAPLVPDPRRPSKEADGAFVDARMRWAKLFAWAGGDAAHLRDKAPELGVAIDHWIPFARSWEAGRGDVTDLSPTLAELATVEKFAADHGYGAPIETPRQAPDVAQGTALLAVADSGAEVAKHIPGVGGALSDPAHGGPFSLHAWEKAFGLDTLSDTKKGLLVGGAVAALVLGILIATAPSRGAYRRIIE